MILKLDASYAAKDTSYGELLCPRGTSVLAISGYKNDLEELGSNYFTFFYEEILIFDAEIENNFV